MTGAPGATAGFSPAGRTLVVLAAAAIAVIGLHLGRDVLAPALLALVVVVTVHPVRRALLARRFPNGVAIGAVVAVSWLVLAGILALVVIGLGQFDRLISDYSDELADAANAVTSLLHGLGFSIDEGSIDPRSLASAVAGLSGVLFSLVVALAFVFTYIIFMAVDARLLDDIADRFRTRLPLPIAAFAGYGSSVRHYYVINTVFGAAVALLDGLVLWGLGVPGALVWAVLAFVTNYIPSIGFVIGLVPPVLLALVTSGWGTALVVLAAYCVINVVLQTFVQPRFVSQAVRLNLTLTFFSVVFWTAVLGPLGAILSIPMTLLARMILLESNDRAAFGRWLTGDRRPE